MEADRQLERDEALAAIIRKYYDLGEVKTPTHVRMAHQKRHQKLVVETSKGRFLIKTYQRDLETLDTLAFQHRLSEHLHANGLPVARIVPSRTGKRICELDNWAMELQQWVNGTPMQVTRKTLSRAGDALGKFHAICRDFPCPDRETRKWRFSEVPREMFGKLYNLAKSSGEAAKVDHWCNMIAIFLQEAGHGLDYDTAIQFETGLVHGDWHSGNLLFQGEKLAAIVDLEFSGQGCFLEDLAYGVSNLCIRSAIDRTMLARRTDLMLEYYQRHRTLSPLEDRALYHAVGIKHVGTVSYQSAQSDGTVAGKPAHVWMNILAMQCEWLKERTHELRS